MESAAGILTVMQQAALEPSADTYTTLLCGYARKGDMTSINATLDTCDKKDIYLLDKDYFDIIYVLTTNGHGELIDLILPRLHKLAGYNQDAVNVILRLTSKGHEEEAFKILKSMPRGVRNDGEPTDTGTFFIKQLVKCGRPVENIMNICNTLEKENLHSKPLLVAIESGLINGMVESTFPLLKEAQKSNLPIRQHYFWPLICSVKEKGNDAVLAVISKMQSEFNIQASNETIRDYVIPNLNFKQNPENLLNLLRSAGVSLSTSASCIVYNLINTNKLDEAAIIASKYRAYYAPGLLRKPLLQALAKTNDIDSYIKIVREIHDGLSRLDILNQNRPDDEPELESTNNSGNTTQNQAEILGFILQDAALYFKKNRVEIMTNILNGIVNEGLTITNNSAERIQDILGSEMNSELSTLLGKLSSGELEPRQLEPKSSKSGLTLSQMDVPQIEKFIANIEAKGENAKNVKRFLLAAAIKKRDLEKTKEILERLNSEGYVLTTGVHAQLIDLYTHHEKLQDALDLFEQIRTKEPDFVLDRMKTVKLVALLVKNNQLNEGIKMLEINKNSEHVEKNFNYSSVCWRLLNSLAEEGKVEELEELFNALIANEYSNVSNVILGPLVKVHLIQNDIKKAVDKFEELCNKHQLTPFKNELTCKLIQAEDAINLQRLTDLSTNIHGEVNSLYDLVFSFVECGRIRQARKILETPGLRNRPQRINSACERYHQEGLIQSLEGLIEATKDLNHINRSDIFYSLLLSYCKDDQPDKALGLWTKMQEESITPSDAFLIKLGNFLQLKGYEVPFVIPKVINQTSPPSSTMLSKSSQSNNSSQTKTPVTNVASTSGSENITQFKQALKRGDIDTALTIKNSLTKTDKLSITDQSSLLELIVNDGRLNEATKIVLEMLESNIHPVPRVFRYYLNKLAASGDVSTFTLIGQKLSQDVKKVVSYDNRLCHANIIAGKTEDYLQNLENDIDNAKTEKDLEEIAGKFPRGGAVGILEGSPELAEKCK